MLKHSWIEDVQKMTNSSTDICWQKSCLTSMFSGSLFWGSPLDGNMCWRDMLVLEPLSKDIKCFNLFRIAVDFGVWDWTVIQTRLFAVARKCFRWQTGSFIPDFQHFLTQVRLGLLFCLVRGIRWEIEVNSETLILPKTCLCCCCFFPPALSWYWWGCKPAASSDPSHLRLIFHLAFLRTLQGSCVQEHPERFIYHMH